MNSLWQRLYNLLTPRFCMLCGRRLSLDEHLMCVSCDLHLPRTGMQQSTDDNLLTRVFWGRMPVERCVAYLYYYAGSANSRLVYNLKYFHHPEIGALLGQRMAKEYAETDLFDGVDLLMPTPLGTNRERQRGYNQSYELARGIASVTHIPIVEGVIRRDQYRQSQTHMDRFDRNDNVEGVFHLQHPERIRGRHLMLVDDVVTTGATLTALGNELLKAGDVTLSVFAWAMTKR